MQAAPLLGIAGVPTGGERRAFLQFDDPAEWSAFGRELEAGGCWESNLSVEGMYCAACSFTVEEALARIPGVQRVIVSAASRRARLVWSPQAVKPSRWLDAVAQLGYRLVPARDE